MICPECNSEIPDDSKECPVCESDTEKKSKKKVHKKGKIRNRIIAALLVAAALAVAVFSIYSSSVSNQGYKKSQKLAKKIGEISEKAYSSVNADFAPSSDYDAIKEVTDYSTVCEADKRISVYGVGLPAWAIFCSEDSFGKLESITYCDFRVLKNNINGIQKSSRIDSTQITTGMKSSDVEKILDMKPYQIVYSGSSVSKKYKYFFKDKQNDNIKAYYITVIFSSENNKVNSPVIEETNNFIYEILKSEKN